MITLDQIRQKFPSAQNLTDGELIGRLSELTGVGYEDVASRFGLNADTSRGVLGAANDYAIEAANAFAGGIGAIGNMVSPGNRFSGFIDENIVKPGEARQSVPVQIAKRRLGAALSTDDIGAQASGVWDYVSENPLLAASQAAGSFAGPALGIKATQFGAAALGARAGLGAAQTTALASRAGLGAGAVISGAMGGGDAAGSAYELVKSTPWETLSQHPKAQELLQQGLSEEQVYEELATTAARRASVVPALIGAVAGATGAEKALTGGVRGLSGVGKTVLKEFGGEALEEGATQYFGQREAAEYNPEINPMAGVVGAGLLGGTLGAGIALPTALANMERPQRTVDDGEFDLTKRGAPQLGAPEITPSITGTDPADLMGNPLGNPLGGGSNPLIPDSGTLYDAPVTQPPQEPQAPAGGPVVTDAGSTNTSKVYSNEERTLIDAGIVPQGKRVADQLALLQAAQDDLPEGVAIQVLDALKNSKMAWAQKLADFGQEVKQTQLTEDELSQVYTLLAQNRLADAKKAMAKAIIDARQAATAANAAAAQAQAAATTTVPPVTDAQGVVNGAQATQAQQAEAQGSQAVAVQPPAPVRQPAAGTPGEPVEAPGVDDSMFFDDTELEDKAEIERLTGNTSDASALLGEVTGQRQDARTFTDADRDAILDKLFEDSQDKPRMRRMFEAFRVVTKNAKHRNVGRIKKAVGSDFGVGDKMIDKVGNPAALVRAGKALGYTEEEVVSMFDMEGAPRKKSKVAQEAPAAEPAPTNDATADLKAGIKRLADEIAQAKADPATKRLRTRATVLKSKLKDKTGDAKAAVQAELDEVQAQLRQLADEQLQKEDELKELRQLLKNVSAERSAAKDDALAKALVAAGYTTEDGESSGIRMDDNREWQKESSSGNQEGDALMRMYALIENINDNISVLQEEGLTNSVDILREQLAGMNEELQQLLAKAAEKDVPKPTSTNLPEDVAAAKQRLKEAKGNVSKLSDADLPLIRGEYARLKNAEGVANVEAEMQKRGMEVPAAEAAPAPVETPAEPPKTETKPKTEAKPKKGAKPAIKSGEDLWNSLAEADQTLKPYEELDAMQRGAMDEIFEKYGTRALKDSVGLEVLMNDARREDDGAEGAKFGKQGIDKRATNPYTAKELLAEIKAFMRADIPGRKLIVVDSVGDLLESSDPEAQRVGAEIAIEGAYGAADNGKAYLVANRIDKGQGRAKFMHEVGGHLGLEGLLPPAVFDRLAEQVKTWAKADDGSQESRLALRAAERVIDADTVPADRRSELVAYFLEEAVQAGIDPTAETMRASSPLRQWFRTLWAAFKNAVRKLGMKPESLTAQDVVNMAYGAARLEIAGAWHGTGTQFRRFNHKYMGSGEGTGNRGDDTSDTGAFGWGTYLAQSDDVATGYFLADRKRKTTPGGLLFDGKDLAQAVVDAWDDPKMSAAEKQALAAMYEQVRGGAPVPVLAALDELNKSLKDKRVSLKDKEVIRAAAKLLGESQAFTDRFTDSPPNKPDGALMRVDTAVADNEMLDWDTVLGEQPAEVQNAVDDAIRTAPGADETIISRFESQGMSMTGAEIYGLLAGRQLDLGTQKAASEHLNKNGIKGLKFLDHDSRKYAGAKFKVTEEKFLTPATRKRPWVVDVTQRSGGTLEMRFATEAEARAWVAEKQQVARNLVIFDDKNIFRVGSQVGGDQGRMKFGKPPTASTIQKNIARLPKEAQGPVRNSLNSIQSWARKALDRVVFTSDLIGRAEKAGVKAARQFADNINRRGTFARSMEREVEKIADMYADIPDTPNGKQAINDFLFETTRLGKWPYDQGDNKADPDTKAKFEALDPAARRFVRAVFDHGAKVLKTKKDTVLEFANTEYDALIKAAEDANDTKEAARLKREKASELKRFSSLFSVSESRPYAPIRRMGNFVVVAKSAEYLAAERAGDKSALSKLEQSPDHYRVSFKDTQFTANQLRDNYEAAGFTADAFLRSKAQEQFFQGSEAMIAMTKLQSLVRDRAGRGDKASAAMQQMVSDLFLQTLADNSARKAEIRRRNIPGEVDMLQSFAVQGRADAQFVAGVRYNQSIQDSIRAMTAQASKAADRNRANEAVNELTDRYNTSLEFEAQPWLNKLTRLSSVYFLATSPAYYLQNLTQPWMMSLPAMAGRFDYTKAAAMLGASYAELKDVMKSAKLFEQGWDFSKVPADVREVIQELTNRGRIDIGLDTELGEFQIEEKGRASKVWNKIDKGMRLGVQKVEALNRLTTAMTAYRLELAKSGSKVAALEYADRILSETHGDYGAFNAPKLFNTSFGKVALQFRKFQLIQLSFYAKLLRDAFTNPAERKAAVKTLTYALGHTALLAGAVGMPGYAAIAWLLGVVAGDDDEPYDLTYKIRKLIGDEDVANLVLRGAPTLAGVDISGKVGAGTMLSIMPFNNADLSTSQGRNEAMGALVMGASGAVVNRLFDGLGQALSGDWLRGMEYMLPKGLGDALKAARINQDGMTRRNGDVILPADEVSLVESIIQGIGFLPADQAVVYERRNRSYEMDNTMQNRSRQIKQQYAKAVREGDTEAKTEARQAWAKLQEARRRNGYTVQPLSELLKAPQEQAKRERNTAGGVQYNRNTEGFARQNASI